MGEVNVLISLFTIIYSSKFLLRFFFLFQNVCNFIAKWRKFFNNFLIITFPVILLYILYYICDNRQVNRKKENNFYFWQKIIMATKEEKSNALKYLGLTEQKIEETIKNESLTATLLEIVKHVWKNIWIVSNREYLYISYYYFRLRVLVKEPNWTKRRLICCIRLRLRSRVRSRTEPTF